MLEDETMILKIAQAIEGPHNINGIADRYSIINFRARRWEMLTTQEKNYRMNQAKAAIVVMQEFK